MDLRDEEVWWRSNEDCGPEVYAPLKVERMHSFWIVDDRNRTMVMIADQTRISSNFEKVLLSLAYVRYNEFIKR